MKVLIPSITRQGNWIVGKRQQTSMICKPETSHRTLTAGVKENV